MDKSESVAAAKKSKNIRTNSSKTKIKGESSKKKNNSANETIDLSRQLSKAKKDKSKPKSKLCGSSNVMPCLKELEAIYADDLETGNVQTNIVEPLSVCMKHEETINHPLISTPPPPIDKELNIFSPTTLQELTKKVVDCISKIPLLQMPEEGEPPVLVPQKQRKRKQNIVPSNDYIKVKKSNNKSRIGVGETKYGYGTNVRYSDDSDTEEPRGSSKYIKRLNRCNVVKRTRHTLTCDDEELNNSSDSGKTECYNVSNKVDELAVETLDSSSILRFTSPTFTPRKFSPIPSTSRDNETFEKNDIRFRESLLTDCSNDDNSTDEIEIIETPCETIDIIDEGPNERTSDTAISIDLTYPEVILEEDSNEGDIEILNNTQDPGCSSFNNNNHHPFYEINNNEDDDCEIIDVDSIIAENNTILEKYNTKYPVVSTITKVGPDDFIEIKEPPVQKDLEAHLSEIVKNFFINYNTRGHKASEISNCEKNSKTQTEPYDSCIILDEGLISIMFKNIFEYITSLPVIKNAKKIATVLPSVRNLLNNYANSLNVVDTVNLDEDSVINISDSVNSSTSRTVQQLGSMSSENESRYRKNKGKKKQTPTNSTLVRIPTPEPSPSGRGLGDCPICMESLTYKQIASTICGHIFCMICIETALRSSGVKRCPTCRKTFKKNATCYHQLFF